MRCINTVSRCGAIYRADRLKGTDLGDTHHSYILTLCRCPGISQDSLARKLFINKSNVTRTLAYLESHGYVRREQSPNDRRVLLVYPTEKAQAALPGIRSMLRDWNAYMAEALTEEEAAQLTAIMPKLAKRAAAYAGVSDEVFGDGNDAKATPSGPPFGPPSGRREDGGDGEVRTEAEEKEDAPENA